MEEHARKPGAETAPASSQQARPRLVLVSNRVDGTEPSAPRAQSASAAEQLLMVELPPRPGVLAELGVEMQNAEPDFDRVSELVTADVGLGAAVIKTANSPYIGLGRRVTSVQQAIYYLGLAEVFVIVTGLLLRRAFPSADPHMEQVWEASAKRAALMGRLGHAQRGLPRDRVHTCGLFENCGVAVLLLHAPGYSRNFAQIDAAPNPHELERTQYGLDHTVIGGALVRTWGLSEEVALAVRHHHDLLELEALELPIESRTLIALSTAVAEALARSAGHKREEWAALSRGGRRARLDSCGTGSTHRAVAVAQSGRSSRSSFRNLLTTKKPREAGLLLSGNEPRRSGRDNVLLRRCGCSVLGRLGHLAALLLFFLALPGFLFQLGPVEVLELETHGLSPRRSDNWEPCLCSESMLLPPFRASQRFLLLRCAKKPFNRRPGAAGRTARVHSIPTPAGAGSPRPAAAGRGTRR